jgi:predicted RNase H-like HicB family nuclease
MKEIIFMLEEDPEGGFTARALGLSIFTQGNTIDEIKKNIKDAVRCHFETEEEIPKVIRLHQVKEEVFTYA